MVAEEVDSEEDDQGEVAVDSNFMEEAAEAEETADMHHNLQTKLKGQMTCMLLYKKMLNDKKNNENN